MDGTARMRVLLERFGPLAGDVGGLAFAAFWLTHAHEVSMPGALVPAIDLLVVLTVVAALLSYQLVQGDRPFAWMGWAGIAAMGYGFTGQWSLLGSGLALFGISVVLCGVHARLPGLLLAGAGTALLVVEAFAPVFDRPFAYLQPEWRAVSAVALVLVAAALTDLDVTTRERSAVQTRLSTH